MRLCENGMQRKVMVHALVLESFIGLPHDGHEGNHRNGVKHDNRLSNLEYVTRSENARHAFLTGLNVPLKHEQHPMAKLTWCQVKCLRKVTRGIGVMARGFGITYDMAKRIRRGDNWRLA